jgi:two-component system cell cycle response regulator
VQDVSRELQPLLAVVAATLNTDGTLLEANAGFRRIMDRTGRDPSGENATLSFVQPSFAALLDATDEAGEIYHGLMTLGDKLGGMWTLRGRAWRLAGILRVIAEYDIDELERLNTKVLELNADYANAQLELAQTNLKLQQREAQIVALTLIDPLTGLGNRRRFDHALVTEVSRSRRTGETLCAFMADLDHFKRVNDDFGHEVGDELLVAFAEMLRRQTRATEIVARIGGEEFVVLMPHTDLEHGVAIAERIRGMTAAVRIDSMSHGVTASFGVAELAVCEDGNAFMRRVDKALYEAKHSGRDRVIAATEHSG